MKKFIALLATAALSATLLVGCNGGGSNNGGNNGNGGYNASTPIATGKLGASLLLANERLNAKALSNDNIFENGSAALRDLSDKAIASLAS